MKHGIYINWGSIRKGSVTYHSKKKNIPDIPPDDSDDKTPEYVGNYEVMPSECVQVLSTAGTKLSEDVVVNPIPNNYGRIEWNGVTLKVF